MEMTASGSFTYNFLEWIRKFVGDQQESHSLVVPFFGLVAHFYEFTLAMIFSFSRISKTYLETSVEHLQRHLLNHPACFFLLEKTTDRQIDFLF